MDLFKDPAVTKFRYPNIWPRQVIKDDLTIDVKIFMRNIENFEEMVLKLDGKEIYRGSEVEVKLTIPFADLKVGYHKLIAETMTKDDTAFSHFVEFMAAK
jgi:hypothetical protein